MTLGELWRRMLHLVRGSRASDELREEMQLHVEMRAEANRRAGMDGADAEFAARRQFGNQVALRADSRESWGFAWPEETLRDLRYALRRLVQRPGFALAVIGVMALGIGATTAMFSAVDAAMLRPLPFPNAGELVDLKKIDVPFDPGTVLPTGGSSSASLRYDVHGVMFADVAEMRDVFSHIAAYAAGGLNLADPEHPLRLKAGVVTVDFFRTLGVAPETGRTFAASEGVPNGPNVVVLSYGLWQRLYAGRDALNSTVQLSSAAYTVIGVMPRGFSFPGESDLWIPMSVPITFSTFSAFSGFLAPSVIARVAPGVKVGVASDRLLARWKQAAAAETPIDGKFRPAGDKAKEFRESGALTSLQRGLVGSQRTALLMLLCATVLLLLIACANVTNLLLSHAAARRHEIALRAVLGASRGRIVQQLLTESVVLACTGAALGVALAPALLGVVRVLMPAELAGVAPAHLDLRVLAFATVLALATGIAFGLWPALGITREAPAETIKSGSRSATSRRGALGRRALAGTELALTLILLVGAGLMLRSFQRVMELNTGMDTDRVGTLEMVFPKSAGDRSRRLQVIDDILARLLTMPGISAVGVVNDLPMSVGGRVAVGITVEGAPKPKGDGTTFVRWLMANSGYFEALGIPLKHGRLFTAADDSLAPKVVVINETMARSYWAGADPVGRTFTAMGPTPITVIGVVADVRESLRGAPMKVFPQMYAPVAAQTPDHLAIVARGSLPPKILLARMTEAVRAVDRSQAVFELKMMDEVVGNSVAPRRANTLLVSIFATLALILSAIGVYAVVSHGVAQRTRELGIRTALGANGRDLLSLVARDMVWVTVTGLGVGLAGAWAIARVLESLLYGVTVHDTLTFVTVPLVLVVSAAFATLVPARRAMFVNPADVMRAD